MTTNVTIKIFIIIGLILPILILTFNKERKNFKNILLFLFYYLLWCFFNSPLRDFIPNLDFIDSKWNWVGKILAFSFSILFIFIFRKNFKENNFFTLKQKEKSIKPILLVIGLILLISILFNYFTPEKLALSFDTLAFQISMPGLDEEFAFRGIMLGLLLNSLNDFIQIGKFKLINPSLLITAILFGLIHGIPLTPYLDFKFDYFSFCYTFIFGLVWGWMALKSKSILAPILSHSLTNFTVTLITMIK